MKDNIKLFIIFSVLLLAIPSVVFFKKQPPDKREDTLIQTGFSENDKIRILNDETGEVSEISLNDYLTGSVLAQIPCTFDEEAVKAQAVLCRTYIIGRRLSLLSSPQPELKGADITSDWQKYPKYFTPEQAEEFYGEDYPQAYEKASLAVRDTSGQYLTYEGSPIIPAFHAVSHGRTESAENAWGEKIPYLVSVDSSPDAELESARQTVTFTPEEIAARLSENLDVDLSGTLPGENTFSLTIPEGSACVSQVEITSGESTKKISGSEFARCLNLNSCCFSIEYSQGGFNITCRGIGHMVGLSQYGANCMAGSGSDHKEILSHYFPGTSLELIEE